MKKSYLIFAAMTIATGCCKDVTVFVLDQEAEFYNPNQKNSKPQKASHMHQSYDGRTNGGDGICECIW